MTRVCDDCFQAIPAEGGEVRCANGNGRCYWKTRATDACPRGCTDTCLEDATGRTYANCKRRATGTHLSRPWEDCPPWEQEYRDYLADKYGHNYPALDEGLEDGHKAVELFKKAGRA